MLGQRVARVVVAAVLVMTSLVSVADTPAGADAVIVVTTSDDVVDGTDGLLSLREAVIEANATVGADVIELDWTSSYDLTRCGPESGELDATVGDLDLTGSGELEIDAKGASVTQTCGAGTDRAVFTLASGGTFDLVSATVSGGDVGVRIGADGHVALTEVTVTGNEVGLEGSGDDLDEARVQITLSSIDANGAGITDASGGYVLLDSSVSDNEGAGIVGLQNAMLSLTGSEVSRNGGDGIAIGSVEAKSARIDDNGGSGAILGWREDLAPAPVWDNTDVWLSSVQGNAGVGLDLVDGDLTLSQSSVSANAGGGVSVDEVNDSSTIAWIMLSTVAGNGGGSASQRAGGVEAAGSVKVLQSTVTANRGAVGGISALANEIWIFASTVAGNEGSVVDDIESTSIWPWGSILGERDESTPNCSFTSVAGTGWNLDADGTCSADAPSDLVGLDPRLGPLADNGGPTLTRLPGLASPAIDGFLGPVDAWGEECGETPVDDQRGVVRAQGVGCDIGAVEVEVPDGAPHFADVGLGHPFFWEVECLTALGATEGYPDGRFRPGRTITRQGMVAWLWRLAGEPESAGPPQFSDVPADHPFADPIAWADEEGVVTGFADGTFRPGSQVTRQAAAAWMWRLGGEPAPSGPPTFADVPASSAFADAVAWMAERGITEGYPDGTFRPAASITRQAVAAWVCRDDALTG